MKYLLGEIPLSNVLMLYFDRVGSLSFTTGVESGLLGKYDVLDMLEGILSNSEFELWAVF